MISFAILRRGKSILYPQQHACIYLGVERFLAKHVEIKTKRGAISGLKCYIRVPVVVVPCRLVMWSVKSANTAKECNGGQLPSAPPPPPTPSHPNVSRGLSGVTATDRYLLFSWIHRFPAFPQVVLRCQGLHGTLLDLL